MHIRVRDDAVLQLVLPTGYPATVPPIYQFSPPWNALSDSATVAAAFDAAFEKSEPVIFTWITIWKDHLDRYHPIEAAVIYFVCVEQLTINFHICVFCRRQNRMTSLRQKIDGRKIVTTQRNLTKMKG